jgi:hypothetical protein
VQDEYICISTETPDHPTAAAVRIADRERGISAAQAAAPDVNSKKEKIIAFRRGAPLMHSIAEIQPTAQVKKVTRAHTDITAPAADETESMKILKKG